MILQTANIVSGFLLATPKLKSYEGVRENVEKISAKLEPQRVKIGFLTLTLGIIGLFTRIGLIYPHIPMFGASFPQALPAIAVGLLLSESFFKKYPQIDAFIAKLKPHQVSIGIVGMASGTGSLLFGCVLPFVCGAPF
jgi:hypothetical protein